MKYTIENLKHALFQMGYRPFKNKWLKPIGYQLFCFNEEDLLWINYFKSFSDGAILIYDKKNYTFDIDPLLFLKKTECITKSDFYGKGNSEFHLDIDFNNLI